MLSLLAILVLGVFLFMIPELFRQRPDHYEYPDIPGGDAPPPAPRPDDSRAGTPPAGVDYAVTAADEPPAADYAVTTPVVPPSETTAHGMTETPPDLKPLISGFIMAEILSPPLARGGGPIPCRRHGGRR